MNKYENYFLMKAEDTIDYIKEKVDFFEEGANLEAKEIGDGNLNYVFKVKDVDSGKSIIIKQAGEVTRISEDMKLSVDRGRIEASVLTLQGSLAPGIVPKVYLYDDIMCTIIMEDMVDHEMMRPFLMNFKTYENFAEDTSTFLANTLISTSDIVMNHKEKKELVRDYINPDLCEISEDLVYTEPFNDMNNRNNVFPPIKDFVEKELYSDEKLHLEVAKLKFDFMNNAQSLIHGDLHTGSVFINKEHMYIFDPEFAFYGPMGYDIGNVIANMFFAWCHADAVLADADERKEPFKTWVITQIKDLVDLFIEKYNKIYDEKVNDEMAKVPGFKEYYLSTILADTAGVAGLESIRRIVGMANVIDITSIEDEAKRARAEKIVITLGKKYILDRHNFKSGQDYVDAINEVVNQF